MKAIAALAALAIASSLLIPQAYAQDWLFGPPKNIANVTLFGNETIANQSQFEIRPEWQPPQSKSESEIETNQITKIKIADLNKSITSKHNDYACPDGFAFVIDSCQDVDAILDEETREDCRQNRYCDAYKSWREAGNEQDPDGIRIPESEGESKEKEKLGDLMKTDGNNNECRNCDDIGEDLGELMD